MINRSVPVGLTEQRMLAWLNPITLSIITVIISLFQARSMVNSAVDLAEREVNGTCARIDGAATTLTNIPAMLKNQAIGSIHETVADAQKMFLMVVNIVQGILEFCISMFRSTIICLLMLVINGTMTAITDVAGALQSAVESIVNGAESVIDKIGSFFGKAPDGLPNVTLNFTGPLQAAQQDLQKFTNDPYGFIDSRLDQLFDMPRKLINDSFASWSINIPNATIQQRHVCNVTTLMDGLEDVRSGLVFPIWMAILGCAIFIAIYTAVNCMRIGAGYKRREKIRHEMVDFIIDTPIHTRPPNHDDSYIQPRSFDRDDLANRMAIMELRQRKSLPGKIMFNEKKPLPRWAQWWMDFITHPFAIYCLILGLLGLSIIYILLACMDGIQNAVMNDFARVIDNWTEAITAGVANATTSDINEFNAFLKNSESSLNNNTLGFVRNAATTLDNLLNTTVQDVTNGIQSVFHSTFLANAILDVLRCIILNKIENLEKALEWVAANFYITFSTINPNLIPQSMGTDLTGDIQNSTAFTHLWNAAKSSLSDQLVYYWTVLAMYFACLLVGVGICIWSALLNRRNADNTTDNYNEKNVADDFSSTYSDDENKYHKSWYKKEGSYDQTTSPSVWKNFGGSLSRTISKFKPKATGTNEQHLEPNDTSHVSYPLY